VPVTSTASEDETKRRRETVNVLIDSFLGWRTLMTFTNQSAAAVGGSKKMIISCKRRY
jgi:hypothetical protein